MPNLGLPVDPQPATHELKVVPPYFDSLVSGSKTFEVRKNDRAYQRGDILKLREWHPNQTNASRACPEEGCSYYRLAFGHWSEVREHVTAVITFVYSGDSRFGGIEPGFVVLGFKKVLHV